MEQFKTKHYTFDFDPIGVQPTKITNKDGKSFYVMADELMGFVAQLVRAQRIRALEMSTDGEVLGLGRLR